MISRVALTIALNMIRKYPKQRPRHDAIGALDAMLRAPLYEHRVRYPIERATAEDNQVLPCREAAVWLYDEFRHGTIGMWDSTVCNDARYGWLTTGDMTFDAYTYEATVTDAYYVIVSFENIEDAVLFRLRWSV